MITQYTWMCYRSGLRHRIDFIAIASGWSGDTASCCNIPDLDSRSPMKDHTAVSLVVSTLVAGDMEVSLRFRSQASVGCLGMWTSTVTAVSWVSLCLQSPKTLPHGKDSDRAH